MSVKISKSYWVIAASVLALMAFIAASSRHTILSWFADGSEPAPRHSYDLKKFQDEVESLRNSFRSKNHEMYLQFEKEIANAGQNDFNTARQNIKPTVGYFGQFDICGKLLYSMARDKIKKSSTAQDMVSARIGENIISPCAAGAADISETADNFIHKLQENDNIFRMECAKKLQELPVNSADHSAGEKFLSDLEKFNDQVFSSVQDKAFVALGATVEVILWRQTYHALIRIAGKTVGRIALSSAAPWLDGPLPIGDVIAVSGLAWCAYDIYKITKILPAEMDNTLTDAVNNFQQNSRQQALDMGLKAWKASSASADKLIAELKEDK